MNRRKKRRQNSKKYRSERDRKKKPRENPEKGKILFQYDCDVSISLCSDGFELRRKTPSPQNPAAKKIDLKRTPESKIEKQYIGQECWKRNPD